eukprot:TRINITY_DN16114_c0_g1_i1.p1 TRINITY_DN16114_c0_g1~~TRINITY_DN16114_c0_g1_i1.p1  ORF type:complete len:376 (+),score=73.79 TRINITY_DN16114_c0_g1_i1:73-1200(+)
MYERVVWCCFVVGVHLTLALPVIPITFPAVLQTANFSAVWNHANPHVDYYAFIPSRRALQATKIFQISLSELREVHYPTSLSGSYTIFELSGLIKRTGSTVQSQMFNQSLDDFDTTYIDEPERRGILFNKILDNGANFTIIYTVNNVDEEIDIPRHNGCGTFCRCEEYYPLKKNGSVKFSVEISNWPFLPANVTKPFRKLMLTIDAAGILSRDYYLGGNFDVNTLLDRSICGLGNTVLNMSDGEIFTTFSMFTDGIRDGTVVPLINSVDITEVAENHDGIGVPLRVLFPDFNDTMFYDPDLSMVFADGNHADDGNQEIDENPGSDDSDNNAVGIAVGVTLGVVICVVAAVVAIGAILVYLKKRQAKKYNTGSVKI